MRFKSWPLYGDWCDIFGKDRATGENAQRFADAVDELPRHPELPARVVYDVQSRSEHGSPTVSAKIGVAGLERAAPLAEKENVRSTSPTSHSPSVFAN
ncbi:hypothetical protein PHJA_001810300 [Phtheirospermum japonicum]|uniref:Uncharacterized protein n=1 Tax=Phtheirospermum japonicum TaxID=374723 RepID=A0A830CE96_9LAMI|nr:hypothetical protein PHJA_001810300 [Phtheirospermum japonicum]